MRRQIEGAPSAWCAFDICRPAPSSAGPGVAVECGSTTRPPRVRGPLPRPRPSTLRPAARPGFFYVEGELIMISPHPARGDQWFPATGLAHWSLLNKKMCLRQPFLPDLEASRPDTDDMLIVQRVNVSQALSRRSCSLFLGLTANYQIVVDRTGRGGTTPAQVPVEAEAGMNKEQLGHAAQERIKELGSASRATGRCWPAGCCRGASAPARRRPPGAERLTNGSRHGGGLGGKPRGRAAALAMPNGVDDPG